MTIEKEFYCYVYYNEQGNPYYVGKGQRNRAFQKRSIPVPPKKRICIRYFQEEEQAFRQEQMLIAFWGRSIDGGLLENITTGGPGTPSLARDHRGKRNPMYGKTHSKAAREKIAAAHKGKRKSPESVRKRVEQMVKTYIVTCPDGSEERVTNLHQYCLNNGLTAQCMYAVASGRAKSHFKYKCRYA